MASKAFQGLMNKPLDFGGSTFAPSAQAKGTPSQYSSASPSFSAASGGLGVPFTPSAPRMPIPNMPTPSTSGGDGGAPPYAPNVVNQTVSYGGRTWKGNPGQGWTLQSSSGSDSNDPLTYLKIIAARGDLNPKQREEYERLLREEQNRMRPTGIPTAPSAPAPVLPPAQTSVIRPPSGATAPVSSVSQGTQAGGTAFPATTQQGLATQALQTKGLPMPTPTPTPAPTQEEQKQFQTWSKQMGIDPQLQKQPGFLENLLGLMQRSGALGGLPLLTRFAKGTSAAFNPTMKEFLELTRKPQTQGSADSGLSGPTGIPGMTQPIQPEVVAEKKKGLAATPENIMGTKDQGIVKQAIQEHISGKSKMSENDLIAGIASQESLGTINKEIDKAQKAGDMNTVQRLANIHTGVQRQIQFNNILQQAIFAIASGMGSPQARGLTEARLPMIQQAAGAQLEAPLFQQTGIPQQQEGAPISYLPPRLPQEDQTQRNKPPIYPWMTGA